MARSQRCVQETYPLFPMTRYFSLCLLFAVLFLSSCSLPSDRPLLSKPPESVTQNPFKTVTVDAKTIVAGQTIYAPVYSHIYFENQKNYIDLSATLSIRNTDLNNSIIITAARYYDTYGKLVRGYLEQPLELPALASLDFVVERTDRSGGSGANFIVEWVAEKEVSQPIVETVMITAESAQGISFVSTGRVIKNFSSQKEKK